MKKYTTTEKHGFIKKDMVLEQLKEDSKIFALTEAWAQQYPGNQVDSWLLMEWIIAQEEPEFTRSEVIDIIEEYLSYADLETTRTGIKTYIHEWKQDKQKLQ